MKTITLTYAIAEADLCVITGDIIFFRDGKAFASESPNSAFAAALLGDKSVSAFPVGKILPSIPTPHPTSLQPIPFEEFSKTPIKRTALVRRDTKINEHILNEMQKGNVTEEALKLALPGRGKGAVCSALWRLSRDKLIARMPGTSPYMYKLLP